MLLFHEPQGTDKAGVLLRLSGLLSILWTPWPARRRRSDCPGGDGSSAAVRQHPCLGVSIHQGIPPALCCGAQKAGGSGPRWPHRDGTAAAMFGGAGEMRTTVRRSLMCCVLQERVLMEMECGFGFAGMESHEKRRRLTPPLRGFRSGRWSCWWSCCWSCCWSC
jgi:hypothetical protein